MCRKGVSAAPSMGAHMHKSQTEPEEGKGLWRLSYWQLQINPDPGLSRIHPSLGVHFSSSSSSLLPSPFSFLLLSPFQNSQLRLCVVLALFHLVPEIHSPPFIRAFPLSEAPPPIKAENWPLALPASCHCCRSSPTPKKKTVFFRLTTFFLTQQTLQLTPPSCPSPALFRT